jgi:CubicO group peptidase (beta-lactamase class C family)
VDQRYFDGIVDELAHSTVKASGEPGLGSIIISTPERTFAHNFRDTNFPFDIRSISKVPVAMALGVAIASGLAIRGEPVSLDTKILPFFAEYSGSANENAQQIEIRHLITNTIGHRDGFMFRRDIEGRDDTRLLDYIFSVPIEFPPGEHFSYSNVGWYLLSALITRELGLSLAEWVDGAIFRKLGIEKYTWAAYGPYTAGASGLKLYNSDLHKLGRLFLSSGQYAGETVVPPAWLSAMHSPVVRTTGGQDPNRHIQYTAYGYGVWQTERGAYFCDGSAGQYLIVVPSRELVISTVGDVDDMNPISTALREVIS